MIEGSYGGFVAPRGFAGKDGSKYNRCGRNRVTCIMRNCKRLRVKTEPVNCRKIVQLAFARSTESDML